MEREKHLKTIRHSAAHILAEAVQQFFPQAKFAIGPPTQDGFYYDFDLPRTLKPEDLAQIEELMHHSIVADHPFIREEVSKEEACQTFASQPYKLELLEEIPDEKVTIYRQGSFIDLCQGPHVTSTGEVKVFKLLRVAGAYWRGDENRPMLQRIYGTAFEKEEELSKYLRKLEEVSKRDHRRLGRELDLFSVHEEAGAGLIFWHPKGAIMRSLIEDFWRKKHLEHGYELVYTPHLAKADIWERSGHLDFYQESMYPSMEAEGQDYLIKPMNCPGHILIYKSELRSYRQLPLRLAELGTVYRWERSGVLHGLSRVRGFTQDDAHIFCRLDQLEEEVVGVIELARFMLHSFGFEEYQIFLSTRPKNFAGTPEMWERATEALEKSLNRVGLPYEINPGEGVFYGPKIDILLKDALGRGWQGPTIQVDFNLPESFDVSYIGEDGKPCRAVMIHRTVLGSMERFLACLVEHYSGAFPFWLSPVQAMVIPIADRHLEYAQEITSVLKAEGLRVQLDDRRESMNLKIREAQIQKVPYMLIIGDHEARSSTLTVRLRSGENLTSQTLSSFRGRVKKAVESGCGL